MMAKYWCMPRGVLANVSAHARTLIPPNKNNPTFVIVWPSVSLISLLFRSDGGWMAGWRMVGAWMVDGGWFEELKIKVI
jgi:hypothetical protein